MHQQLGPSCRLRGVPPQAAHRERSTTIVVAITGVVMIVEIVVGHLSGSLALSADGWHMATHVAAFLLALWGYWFARTRADDPRFTFGTGKVNALAGYTSAVLLALVALGVGVEAVDRLVHPQMIASLEALPVAVLGLIVNVVCAFVLDDDPAHQHDQAGHAHHHDHSFAAARLHVIADAFTSLFAICALLGARYLGWRFLDPLGALTGAAVIASWSLSLCRLSARTLLDRSGPTAARQAIQETLERIDNARVLDLHLWDLGDGRHACIVSLVSSQPRAVAEYRAAVHAVWPVAHLSVELEHGVGGHHDARA